MKKLFGIYDKYQEIINYLIVGGLTTLVSLVTYYLCVYTVLDPKDAIQLQLANVISWICAVIFAYITNRIFVFKSKCLDKMEEFLSFLGSRIVTLILDMTLMFVLVSCISFNDKISKLIVQMLVIVINYIFSKMFVFKKNNATEL